MAIPGAGAGTREWTSWGHSGNPVDQRNVGQSWYRNPSWGGHVVYNPQYGYQDYPTIEKMYSQAQSPMDDQRFQQAFEGAGMQKQLGGTWGTHYGNDPKHRIVPHQEKMMNQYGVPYNPYGAQAQQGGYGQPWQGSNNVTSQPYGGYQSMYQQPGTAPGGGGQAGFNDYQPSQADYGMNQQPNHGQQGYNTAEPTWFNKFQQPSPVSREVQQAGQGSGGYGNYGGYGQQGGQGQPYGSGYWFEKGQPQSASPFDQLPGYGELGQQGQQPQVQTQPTQSSGQYYSPQAQPIQGSWWQ